MESKKNNQSLKIIKPFGPSVVKFNIPEETLQSLNKYVDDIIKDSDKIKKLDHGSDLAGNVNQEFFLETEFMKSIKWAEFLASACKEWLKHEQNKKLQSFQIIKSWIVRQFKHEYNPIHWHSGHISGAGFLKLPKSFGDFKQKKQNKKYCGGHLELIHGSRMFLSSSKFEIIPQVGDFYFFPNYLMHTVYPFKDTDEERRSISFNATIDDSIYNVYGN